jgi:hypothetical protein
MPDDPPAVPHRRAGCGARVIISGWAQRPIHGPNRFDAVSLSERLHRIESHPGGRDANKTSFANPLTVLHKETLGVCVDVHLA